MKYPTIFRAASGVFIAALIGVVCWTTPPGRAAVAVVAQMTPTPGASESPMPASTEMPMPASTEMPMPAATSMPGTTTAPGTGTAPAAGTDMLNSNPNGADWLSKFARNPGPATNMRMPGRRHTMPVRVRMMHRPATMHHPVTRPAPAPPAPTASPMPASTMQP